MQTSHSPSLQPSLDDVHAVSPALAHAIKKTILGGVWQGTELLPRDRSVVTLSAVIARNQTVELTAQIHGALDNGVKAAEISEIINHLAFYSGLGNAMSAVVAAKAVFDLRGISVADLPLAEGEKLPVDEATEAKRSTTVEQNFGATAPGVVRYTTDVLFLDLWLRPGLAPRDRSLVTVAALIASGQVLQITFHLNRAMDNGLTQAEAAEVLAHLAFYSGWPCVMSALPVVKDVFEKRPG
jgi:4-carboxymuconolactone decarboxylase